MTSRSIRFLGCSGVLGVLLSAAVDAGGWVVITVKNLPDHVIAGKPVTLTYTVRQHGRTLLGGLDGRLEMRAGDHLVRAVATSGPEVGNYSATFTLPNPGSWTVDILSGFGGGIDRSRIVIPAIERVGRVPVTTDTERGQRLFVAKGCVTCHVHSAVAGQSVVAGPDLAATWFQRDYLRRFLADPSRARPAQPELAMPDLKLREAEIAALVAFLIRG